MRKRNTLFYTLILFLSSTCFSYANQMTAVKDGPWNDDGTWLNGEIPGPQDTAVINSFQVTVTSNITVKRIVLTNLNGSSGLTISTTDTLTVSDDINATSYECGICIRNVDVNVVDNGVLIIGGDLLMTRDEDNGGIGRLQLYQLSNSKVFVGENFIYNYDDGSSIEGNDEILLQDQSILDVSGNTTFSISDGSTFTLKLLGTSQTILRGNLAMTQIGGNFMRIEAKDSTHLQVLGNATFTKSGGTNDLKINAAGSAGEISIQGDVTLNSTVANSIVYMNVETDGSVIEVEGDVTMNALSQGDVYIKLDGQSNFYIGGNFSRPNGYGALDMSNNSTLTYNGTGLQEIAPEEVANSGTDEFSYSNVILDNPNGFTLTDTLFVEDSFDLNSGNIKTTDEAPFVLGDNATLTGGSETSYINGPMIKKGRSAEEIVFPVGTDDEYAPVGTSKTSNIATEIKVKAYSDPPPFGTNVAEGEVDNVKGHEYWEVITTSGSEDVNVIIHYQEAPGAGITDMSKLIVAGWSTDNEWKSLGNSGTSGTVDTGSVTNSMMLSDPPPFGTNYFTLGSVSALNLLPVELENFKAIKNDGFVLLDWTTLTELNSESFIIERAKDGVNFEAIGEVKSIGNTNTKQQYFFRDTEPMEGGNYYRLKMMDTDDKFDYSPIQIVNYSNDNELTVFPNPVQSNIEIMGLDESSPYLWIQVYDNSGKLLFQNDVSVNGNSLSYSTDQLNIDRPGYYVIRIIQAAKTKTIKFLKVN